jgi:hypothetical protein
MRLGTRVGLLPGGIVALLSASVVRVASCQELTTISSSVGCPRCTLALEQLVVLGTAEGSGIIESEVTAATRDTRGRFYVRGSYATEIKVFGTDGRLITTIGRAGDGPGEFRGIATVHHTEADTLHVFDESSRRYTVFSPAYEYVRSSPLEIAPYTQVVLLGHDRIVFASPVRTPDRAGLPLHLLSPSGRVIRSFGSVTGALNRSVPYTDERVIAKAGPNAVWSGYRNRYTIELWRIDDRGDRLIQVVERQADWFPPEPKPQRTLDDPPAPRLQAIQFDDDGHLLVIILVPDEAWEKAVTDGPTHPTVSSFESYYDSIIEMLDPSTGKLLASTRSRHVFQGFVDDGMVSAVFTDQQDVPYLGVWRVRFQP